jgi:hypothetical protein
VSLSGALAPRRQRRRTVPRGAGDGAVRFVRRRSVAIQARDSGTDRPVRCAISLHALSTGNMGSMPGIAKIRAVVLDCPEPRALAEFYRELVGGDITYADEEWVSLRDDDTVLLSFQLAPDYQPPTWPEPDRPQQFHLDVTVEEAQLDEAEQKVLALGARRHELQPGGNWRVYVDPVGHLFCFCWD